MDDDRQPEVVLPYFEVFVELIGSIAWPAAVVVAAYLFSNEIRSAIPRIKKVGTTGVELESLTQLETPPTDLTKNQAIPDGKLLELRNPIAAKLEEENRQDLQNLHEADDALTRENILLRALTRQQMMKAYAIAYSGIFGSQIRALRELNSRRISREEAEEMLEEIKSENPNLKEFSLDIYLNYLEQWSFIEHSDGYYSISENGRDFLQFLVESRLSEERGN